MKITEEFLLANDACLEGIEFVKSQKLVGLDDVAFLDKLIELDKSKWANWLMVRVLPTLDKVRYAIYASEQVIDIFEKEYPDDDRPRKAIESAKGYIKNPCEKTVYVAFVTYANAAAAAAYAIANVDYVAYTAVHANITTGYTVANAAHAAYAAVHAADAVNAAANAAYSAAYAARAVAFTAYTAADATDAAVHANSAGDITQVTNDTMLKKIINHGIELIKGGLK